MLDGLVTAIVRPLRAQYSHLELGPPRLRYGDVEYQRNDFIATNSRGLQIQGSYWSIISSNLVNTDSCIIYLHPNSGSRIDVMKNSRIMSIAAHLRANVCSFDFGGCGDSEGDCISLGVREKEDVCAVISHLLSQGCRRFILWGRSMGAATAAMFYGAYKELLVGTVIALILDSPFTSLNGLATQFTLTRSVPGLILAPALQYIRHSILSLHGFDIMQATPVAAAQRINIPTIVLTGSEDKTVPPVLSEELYRALVGPKMRIFFVGSHNSKRPTAVFEALKYFLTGAMKGLSVPELLDSSVEFMRKDIIPDTVDIHGVAQAEPTVAPEVQVEAAPTHAAPSEETVLEALGCHSSPKISPRVTQGKKKIHRSPSSSSPDHPHGSSHPPPWNPKWEMSREHHSYGSRTTHPHIHGIRRSTTAAIHSHVNTQRVGHHEQKQQAAHQRKPSRPCIHSITVDNGNGAPKQFPVPSEESPSASADGGWIGAIGAIGAMIWGAPTAPETPPPSPSPFSRPVEFAGSPAGSLGYLLHHLESDICPPEASAWETVLLNRAVEEIADAVINQTIALATGLLDASMETTPTSLITRDVEGTCPLLPAQGVVDNPSRVALHLFRQVSTELGFVSIAKLEAQQWSSLLLLCPRELFEIIHKKDCDAEDRVANSSPSSPEDQSGRSSGENISSDSSNPDPEEIDSSTPLLHQKPTN